MKKIIIIIFLTVYVFSSNNVMGKIYDVGNWEIELNWKQRGTKLKLWGKVKEGFDCKMLRVNGRLWNERNGHYISFLDYIEDYDKNHWETIRDEMRVKESSSKTDITSKFHWKVNKLRVTCEDNEK
ncbi:MAG: hypothetical protein OCC45_06310 [Desulfotalea sp.]